MESQGPPEDAYGGFKDLQTTSKQVHQVKAMDQLGAAGRRWPYSTTATVRAGSHWLGNGGGRLRSQARTRAGLLEYRAVMVPGCCPVVMGLGRGSCNVHPGDSCLANGGGAGCSLFSILSWRLFRGKKKSRSEITGAFLSFPGMRGILCDLGNGLNQSAGVELRVGALGGEQGLAWSFRKAEQEREASIC